MHKNKCSNISQTPMEHGAIGKYVILSSIYGFHGYHGNHCHDNHELYIFISNLEVTAPYLTLSHNDKCDVFSEKRHRANPCSIQLLHNIKVH